MIMHFRKCALILASLAFALDASAAPVELVKGKLVGGGGSDDVSVTILSEQGKKIEAYCVGKCGDWFVDAGEGESVKLNPKLKGKPVSATIATERNAGRIAGPDDNERFQFIKSITLGR